MGRKIPEGLKAEGSSLDALFLLFFSCGGGDMFVPKNITMDKVVLINGEGNFWTG